ncbi:unnamed protein product [Gongylonema pulchrum]|uniref:Uncharacterized protein n=1 Tax=Gongylonema pulchrum TaxID=637853 RepID=A0A183E2U1_9BILA|nr:unnamed protein product [Gongylonema pulchrum]
MQNGLLRCPYQFQYFWHVICKKTLLKLLVCSPFQILGLLFYVMTGFVMWSECTFFIIHPRLSLAAQFVHLAAHGYHYLYIQVDFYVSHRAGDKFSPFFQICATAIISYLCVCAYYTVFKLRIYRYYRLDPHHITDENSLLFSAILLCRLTPPICLNVLGMIHLDSHITSDTKFGVETQFTKLMGHLDVIPILARGINIYLPILIVLLALGTWLRLVIDTATPTHAFIRHIVLHNTWRYMYYLQVDAEISHVLERNKITRAANREERDQYWTKKLTTNTSAGYGASRGTNNASVSNYRFPGINEYSDREPIIGADDGDEYSPLGIAESSTRNHDSPGAHPPPNMFDDL